MPWRRVQRGSIDLSPSVLRAVRCHVYFWGHRAPKYGGLPFLILAVNSDLQVGVRVRSSPIIYSLGKRFVDLKDRHVQRAQASRAVKKVKSGNNYRCKSYQKIKKKIDKRLKSNSWF